MPNEDGEIKRKILLQAEYSGAPPDPMLENEPQAMYAGAHLLDWFWDLCSGRKLSSLGMGGACYAPFDFTEIKAWSFLKKIRLTPWDVSAIKALDAVYLKHTNKPAKKNPGAK